MESSPAIASVGAPFATIVYPPTALDSTVDHYGGQVVSDPYRWLEDDNSAETTQWVEQQNAVTFRYLESIPGRDYLRKRIATLLNYPRMSQPETKGEWLLFSRNDGLQNQAVIYVQHGLEGEPAVLLDPNTMSADGTTRVGAMVFNATGNRIAYTLSVAGSDWQEIRVLDTATREPLPDVVHWVKVSDLAWFGDGFFYSRYPEPGHGGSQFSDSNDDHQVFYHALGTAQASDRLVFRDAANTQRFHTLSTTEDERFAVLYVSDRGRGKDGNAMHVMDLQSSESVFRPVWTEYDDQLTVIGNIDNALLVVTNLHAPNGRVVRIDVDHPAESHWSTIIPERAEPLEGATQAGGKLFALYLKDVSSRVSVFDEQGTLAREITLPGVGTVSGFRGERAARDLFYTFTSFTAPPTVYRYDVATGNSTVFRQTALPFDPSAFEATQVFVNSADGTRVPAFIVAKKGLVLNGQNPTIAYGYGGFNVSLLPAFSASRVAFLEQGGVFVQVNTRGGGEYGEAWHQGGMKAHKQNVFDDFTAVLRWLVDNKYTSPNKLAIQGGSNGGLLVGAIMTQHPELIQVALPAVGVMDMLRFHKFTIGWNWIADYGSSDNADEFQALFGYSPLHNLVDGVSYPATLITTGDHDDRVVPAHSFKFAARLQAAQGGSNPTLIRIETHSGHGSSSLSKAIDETADIFAFTLHNMGVEVVVQR